MSRERFLAVFDLDYTVWEPEMYQLLGQPRFVEAPSDMSPRQRKETRTVESGMMLTDKSGNPMRVFPGASFALAEINRLQGEGVLIEAAVASRTDEPSWAQFCMKNLVVEDGMTLSKSFGSRIEISFDNKKHHLQRLHRKTGIPFQNMVFFDNEYSNIRSVSKLGVKCIYTPDGMKQEHWTEATEHFAFAE